MTTRDSQEFSPRPFSTQATPTYSSTSMSDTSDREAPNLQADTSARNSVENRTLTADDAEELRAGSTQCHTNSIDSHSTTSNSPKSGHESSEYSQDNEVGERHHERPPHESLTKQHYKMSTEATSKHSKGRKKKQSSSLPIEESGKYTRIYIAKYATLLV